MVKHHKREDDAAVFQEERRLYGKNPYEAFPLSVAKAGGINLDRIDNFWRGPPVVFEINFNLNFPGTKPSAAPERNKRRAVRFKQRSEASAAINSGDASSTGESSRAIDRMPDAQFYQREGWNHDLPRSPFQRPRWERLRPRGGKSSKT